ncbi:DNA gyrase inhibitor YacG [Thiobacillus sp.]|uniref:DNA gyrase inhibitor YacG n=1 Tax=Thiobacillus sp. TaxID=924 RepID=UPI0011D5F93C|nr:DNA gyrase inhibitor YacG [Thiobacillus sp.]MBC2730413.1 DNA gyrase inhibitor YacG [Thiobacillus sp.]MBC2739151.1 DNA gyrase inhibitor YacG [Thiobacillus sp.]MBC2760564.1 DNA gyrase inhibitor YacG [Thiobacillus sp.]TXH75876.1 MAG: DNA gyrase inhibitor YacG [Thiobacillus sp.]
MKSTATPPAVSCPTCGATVTWSVENRWKPFCSERCKMIDLGQWATEKYRVPAEEQEPDDESPQPQ